jgi:hypothetical protein
MRTLIIAVFASLPFMAAHSQTLCTQAAILGTPKIPATQDSTFSQVADLKGQVSDYIASAEQRLEKCDSPSNPDYPFFHNLAVLHLEQVAERYNALVTFHNASVTVATK